MITRRIRGFRTSCQRCCRAEKRFSISFVFRKNFLIYFIDFLEGVHRLVTIPCYIKHVARTHISISFITLGDFREEAPTPSKFQEPVPSGSFFCAPAVNPAKDFIKTIRKEPARRGWDSLSYSKKTDRSSHKENLSAFILSVSKGLQPPHVLGINMCETGHRRYGRTRTPPRNWRQIYYTAESLEMQEFPPEAVSA